MNVSVLLVLPIMFKVPRPRLSAADWNLSIKNASLADDGMYECQVNTDPKINYKVFLTVTGYYL